MRIIKFFSNLIMFGVFLIGLTAIWTDQTPKEIYRSTKSAVIYSGLLSFEQKIAVNYAIRRVEEAWAGIAGHVNESLEEDIND